MAELHRVHTARGADRPHLVFLHGLGGHPRETWMHNPADHTTLWPQWLGEDADCHAWCLGYDAALSGWTDSAMRIPDQAVAVLNALAVERELRSGPWVLVGHSMGGLVVKEAMRCAANREPHFRPMLDRIAAVVFVATPHRGSQLASLAKALRLLLNTNVHVGDMGRNDAYLRAANQEFKVLHNGGRFQALVLAEGHPVKLTRPWLKFFTRVLHVAVVDLDSADPGLHKVPSRPFPEDHFSIAKPSNRKTTLHKTVVDFLLELKASAAPARQIRAEMHVAVDTAAVRESPHTGQPALLTGPDDNRLLPRENKVYGRDAVVEELLAFLRSARDAALVTAREVSGVGGIGKTEVCKAALRAWLKEWAAKGNPLPPAYYVSVPDRSRPDDLIALLATGVGVPQIDSLAQLLAILPNGLYYLDNLESVAEVAEGQAILRALRDRPGIRLLVSSRLSLPTIMGKPVLVDRLPDDDALALFVDTWAGSSTLPSREALRPFVLQDLGAHPLSLALMARLGDCYAYDDLVKRWHALGTTAADDPADDSRHGSLNISLRLTADALAQRDGALDLWTVVALFPEGMDDATLRALEEVGGWASARPWLARHHVLTQRDGLWSVLPPVARFAQAASLRGDAGFQWTRCRAALQQHYAPSLKAADSIASTQEALFARQWLLRQWNNLTALIRHEAGAADKDSGWLERVHTRLYNQYQFNIVASRGLLTDLATHLPNPASAFESLGDLESRLGEPGKARALYDRALALFEKESDGQGQANTLKSLGDLESRLGELGKARALYDRALALYEKESDGLGQATTLKSLGDLESRLGEPGKARALYDRALALFEKESDGLGQANTLRSLGDLESRLGELGKARALYDRALALYEKESSGQGQANTLQSLGDLESRLGEPGKARALYDRALALYEKESDGLGQANTLRSLGDLESRLGELRKARALYDRALALFEKESFGQGQANTLQSQGDLLREQKQWQSALECYATALNLYAREQEPMGLAYTYAESAKCLHSLKNIAERDTMLWSALGFAQRCGVDSVRDYVAGAATDLLGDEAAFKAWFEARQREQPPK